MIIRSVNQVLGIFQGIFFNSSCVAFPEVEVEVEVEVDDFFVIVSSDPLDLNMGVEVG
jgi:hypothetical protein